MESKGYVRNSGEREINLASMFLYIVKQWKLGLILILIGLVLGVALGAWMDSRVYVPEEEEEIMQIANLQNRYRMYQQTVKERNDGYLTTLSEDKDYYYATIVYYIAASNETDTSLLGNVLNITSTSDYLYDLQEILGVSEDIYISSLGSLLNANFAMYGANSNVMVSLGETADKEVGYGLLTYTLSYLEREQVDRVMEYVDEEMTKRAAEHASAYTYTMEKLRTSVLPYSTNVVLSAQSSIDSANCTIVTLTKTSS